MARLEPNDGLLLVYATPGTRSIWMQDCLIALDVAFLDERGRVLQIDRLPPPRATDDRPERARSRSPALMVLEMPAGFFEKNGLEVGTKVVVP